MRIKNKTKLLYYLLYSAFFTVICLIIFRHFYLNGRTFINHTNDGLVQHYKALIYYSNYLKKIIRNIFVDHRFVIPQWDFSIGEGADILQTLHMYAIGDPLNIFSVFFNENNMYIFYDMSIIIRLFLSGVVFSELCFYKRIEDKFSILAGTLVYVFCYWSLLNVNEHIYFLNPMIYLPLIVLGVEKVLCENKALTLTIAIFVSVISNFYFFYMIVLLTIIYVVVRLLIFYQNDYKTILNKTLTIFISSLIAVGMASVILLPVISTFLSNSRASVDSWCGLFYSRFYYERLFAIFVSNDNQYDLCMGFASPTLLGISLLFKDKSKTGRLLLILCAICLLIICVPFAGKLMNGMAYPINRWSFAVALLVAYIFVYQWQSYTGNRKYLFYSMAGIFCVAMISAWSRQIRVLIPILLCIIFYAVAQATIEYRVKNVILIVVIIANVIFIAEYDYSSLGSSRYEMGAEVKEVIDEVRYSDASVLKEKLETGKNGIQRYGGNHLKMNAAMLTESYSTDFYWSLSNNDVINYREKLGLNDFASYYYRGYDGRSSLYNNANVKYFVDCGYDDEVIPYGFEKIDDVDGYGLYLNNNYLPFGYTYDNYISYNQWDKYSQIEKQEALLEYIVIDKQDSVNNPVYDFEIDYKIYGDDGVTIKDREIVVNKEKATLHLQLYNDRAGEYCLNFVGLEFEDTENIIDGNRTWIRIRTNGNNIEKSIYYFPNNYQFYSGRHDYTICYGFVEKGIDELTLSFPYPGVYSFEKLFVTCNDYDKYLEKIDKLKQDSLNNLIISDNELSGNIVVNKDKYLLLSIPFSDGWKAYVDGKKVETIRANEAYMALKLNNGPHTILMKYETPFLKIGALISLISTAIFIYSLQKKR